MAWGCRSWSCGGLDGGGWRFDLPHQFASARMDGAPELCGGRTVIAFRSVTRARWLKAHILRSEMWANRLLGAVVDEGLVCLLAVFGLGDAVACELLLIGR